MAGAEGEGGGGRDVPTIRLRLKEAHAMGIHRYYHQDGRKKRKGGGGGGERGKKGKTSAILARSFSGRGRRGECGLRVESQLLLNEEKEGEEKREGPSQVSLFASPHGEKRE